MYALLKHNRDQNNKINRREASFLTWAQGDRFPSSLELMDCVTKSSKVPT